MIPTFEFSKNVVGFLIDSDVNSKLIEEIHAAINDRLQENETINLFIEIKPGNNISFSALIKDLKFKTQHASRFKKIAVVTDIHWFQNAMEIKDLIMNAEVKGFEHIYRLKAMNWIAE
ncbi:SpoIIAA-like protein [Gillisia sp. Hel_I_86]|uniref:STAS/SEC14 domain-containing protein n=1 Tax=Gillisia sp. Hel_I_86 TaxID=1249981 RepID=UPI00119A08F4|nr:STAS/SEC14 domain-containing protein [Gillisia sp. Hel_I_86]TVZ27056.1 SpoIIAA-like protein [Gillisia sp. Hel_I_86]